MCKREPFFPKTPKGDRLSFLVFFGQVRRGLHPHPPQSGQQSRQAPLSMDALEPRETASLAWALTHLPAAAAAAGAGAAVLGAMRRMAARRVGGGEGGDSRKGCHQVFFVVVLVIVCVSRFFLAGGFMGVLSDKSKLICVTRCITRRPIFQQLWKIGWKPSFRMQPWSPMSFRWSLEKPTLIGKAFWLH